MTPIPSGSQLNRDEVLNLYFLEHRAKLVDIAAFLDRLDRADVSDEVREDFRIIEFRKALRVLLEKEHGRAKRVLTMLSDPTTEPIQSAEGLKGAYGAYPNMDLEEGKA